jgi:hypothetical protein
MSSARWFGFCGALIGILLTASAAGGAAAPSGIALLHDNWSLQSSCQVKAAGEEISKTGFSTDGWHRAAAPTTVVPHGVSFAGGLERKENLAAF